MVSLAYAHPVEAADQHCLRPGEAATLLSGHPWRRFAVLGDSVAEGVSEPVPGYARLAWGERVAEALGGHRPSLAYLNLGRRDLRAAEVRASQLAPALDFGPDLALIVCGANDALRPGYDPANVDAELGAMVLALRERGALVLTASLFVLSTHPGVPPRLAPAFAERMRAFGRRVAAVGAAYGTVHIGLAGHPAEGLDASVLEADLGSRDQVLHGAGHQHLVRLGQTHDPRGDVDRDPADVAVPELDLTGMHGRPDLKAEIGRAHV